jgi:hypothetical protein
MNEISIFGSKCRIEIVIICLLVGFITGGYMLCGCLRPGRSYFEGMTSNPVSTSQDYNNNGGSQYGWVGQELEDDKNTLGGNDNTYSPANADNSSLMAMFSNTKTSPTCASSLSGKGGIYCVTPEQKTLINQRGGNRTSCGNEI